MRTAGRWQVLWTVALLVWASSASAKAARFKSVRASIQQQVEAGHVPSFAVAVAQRGEILWEEAFGWADRERGVPATPHTMFSLASVSKPLTATGLMLLAERGAVDLDRAINPQLGEVQLRVRIGDPSGATVREVANHTSGLPLHHHFFTNAMARPPLEETIRRYGNLVAEPGERFQYSNLGYAVLEHLIAQASGKPYARFMREDVFEPLGLEHTAVLQAPASTDGFAVRYRSNGQPLPFYGSDHGGGSAAFSCVHDLVRFALFHLQGRLPDRSPVLSDRAIRAMQEPTAERGDGYHYGIGWLIAPGRYRSVVRHDGGMPGATATLVLVPAEQIAVAVLCNTRSDLPQRVAADILSAIRPRGRISHRKEQLRSAERRRRPPRRLVGTWSGGVHLNGSTVPITMDLEGPKTLWTRIGDQATRGKLWGVTYRDGHLTGWTRARLRSDRDKQARVLRLSLDFREDRLTGAVTALSHSSKGLPSALSYWVDLERRPVEPGS